VRIVLYSTAIRNSITDIDRTDFRLNKAHSGVLAI